MNKPVYYVAQYGTKRVWGVWDRLRNEWAYDISGKRHRFRSHAAAGHHADEMNSAYEASFQHEPSTPDQQDKICIFRWKSRMLAQYAQGDLIAMAPTADEARKKLREGLDEWIKEHREWAWHEAFEAQPPDKEGYEALIRLFEADIAVDPTEHETLWISGSA